LSAWNLILLLGVTAIWVAILSALLHLVLVRGRPPEPAAAEVRARRLEPPRALRPSGT
jgi:hypothetical protein